jgi:hypothetical protein
VLAFASSPSAPVATAPHVRLEEGWIFPSAATRVLRPSRRAPADFHVAKGPLVRTGKPDCCPTFKTPPPRTAIPRGRRDGGGARRRSRDSDALLQGLLQAHALVGIFPAARERVQLGMVAHPTSPFPFSQGRNLDDACLR